MTTEVLEGATRLTFFLQTSQTFLNQKFRDQNSGKPKFRGHHFRVNPKNFNYYFHVSIDPPELGEEAPGGNKKKTRCVEILDRCPCGRLQCSMAYDDLSARSGLYILSVEEREARKKETAKLAILPMVSFTGSFTGKTSKDEPGCKLNTNIDNDIVNGMGTGSASSKDNWTGKSTGKSLGNVGNSEPGGEPDKFQWQ